MPIARNRKNQKNYVRYNRSSKKAECDFCEFTPQHSQVVKEFTLFWVVKNIFPYDIWDTTEVHDHLMLVPKRHIDSIGHFNKAEQQDYTEIIGKYDLDGYSLYARSQTNVLKSVPHQHSHLIALGKKPKRILFYLRKPHLLLHK